MSVDRVAGNRPISVDRIPRRALTHCLQLCMGIQPSARFSPRSADALPTTLYGHSTQAIYRNLPILPGPALEKRDAGRKNAILYVPPAALYCRRRCCSPRHTMPSKSNNDGSDCVWCRRRCCSPRHTMPSNDGSDCVWCRRRGGLLAHVTRCHPTETTMVQSACGSDDIASSIRQAVPRRCRAP